MDPYSFAPPRPIEPQPDPLESATEDPEFVARLQAVTAANGGIVTAPHTVRFGVLAAFWAIVNARLAPSGWEAVPAGTRDAGHSRRIQPKRVE